MNDVIRYEATTATDNAVDRFDADNFYPMDGDGDDFYDEFSGLDTDENGVDDEFSEAFGSKLKGAFGKVKGAFSSKKSLEERESELGKRLENREDRVRSRAYKQKMRKDAKQRRKNLRQVALVENNTPQVQQNIAKIVTANTQNAPELKESVDMTAEGFADQVQEQQTQVVVQEANKMAATGETTPPIIELDTTGNVKEVKDTWWKKQGTGVKVAIIGGGVVALGLTIFGIIKIAKR